MLTDVHSTVLALLKAGQPLKTAQWYKRDEASIGPQAIHLPSFLSAGVQSPVVGTENAAAEESPRTSFAVTNWTPPNIRLIIGASVSPT